MIAPVRPVGWASLSAPPVVYALCQRLLWAQNRWSAVRSVRSPLPLLLALRSQLAGATAASVIRDGGAPLSRAAPAVEPWRPWPARGPFALDVTRWWPSDDWPPDEPPIVIEDRIPDIPPALIDWRAIGGLLDFWA